MILSILEPFIFFSVLHDCVICDCDICVHLVIDVMLMSCFLTCVTLYHTLYLSLKDKNKNKTKTKRKNIRKI